jgi:hypothetical protein
MVDVARDGVMESGEDPDGLIAVVRVQAFKEIMKLKILF